VKLDKEFFIGKKPMEQIAKNYDMEVARVELPGEKGIRPVRQNDAVLNSDGQCTGWVLSCAKIKEKQIALVYSRKDRVEKAEHVRPDLAGVVLSRFAKF